MMPMSATWRTMPIRLSGLTKAGCTAEKATTIARIAIASAFEATIP